MQHKYEDYGREGSIKLKILSQKGQQSEDSEREGSAEVKIVSESNQQK